MPNNIIKLVDATQLDIALTATADAIRAKTGDSSQISWDTTSGFADAIDDIECIESADGVSFGTIPLITFTITGTSSAMPNQGTYSAIEGMTLADWVNSEYNIAGYVIDGNYIRPSSSSTYCYGKTHIIIDGETLIFTKG